MPAERPAWAPDGVDLERPNPARVYDYYLGGAHNFAVDRELAEQAIATMPEIPWMMRANRGMLRRAVRFLINAGVTQFLDLGSGIPTEGNVHEVAQRAAPEARVVYVDKEPVAVSHSRQIVAGNSNVAVVRADLREPETVFEHPDVIRMLDRTRPIGLLLFAVLHFVPAADEPASILGRYRDFLAPGSYLALSHGTHEHGDERGARLHGLYERSADPLTKRTREEIIGLMKGFEPVEPGVVFVPEWRPAAGEPRVEHPERSNCFGAVGRLV